jgi:hypothetical protein
MASHTVIPWGVANMRGWLSGLLITITVVSISVAILDAQTSLGTAFTYQGRLTDDGALANGSYDLQFTLFDAATNGNQVGTPITHANVAVTNGVFTVALDYGGGIFTGLARWLSVGVRPGGTSGAFTIIAPRQQLTASPNALYSELSGSVPASGLVGTVPAGRLPIGTTDGTVAAGNDSRLSDARPPTAGSSSYIQNAPASPQAGSINITGGVAAASLSGEGSQLTGLQQIAFGAVDPACNGVGKIFFNTVRSTLRLCDGSSWNDLAVATPLTSSGSHSYVCGSNAFSNTGLTMSTSTLLNATLMSVFLQGITGTGANLIFRIVDGGGTELGRASSTVTPGQAGSVTFTFPLLSTPSGSVVSLQCSSDPTGTANGTIGVFKMIVMR